MQCLIIHEDGTIESKKMTKEESFGYRDSIAAGVLELIRYVGPPKAPKDRIGYWRMYSDGYWGRI